MHVHAIQEDSFFVVEGILTLQVDDEVVELGPGDFATAPPGVAHSFTNARPDQRVCRAANLLTPGIGFDRYLDRLGRLAASGDGEAMARLNDEFGVSIVGPSVAQRLGLSPT